MTGLAPNPPKPPEGRAAGASKYDPLTAYLAKRAEPVVHLSFVQIEQIIGAPLTRSARVHRPWWANGESVQASAWKRAGRRTANVDLNATTVDFVRENT